MGSKVHAVTARRCTFPAAGWLCAAIAVASSDTSFYLRLCVTLWSSPSLSLSLSLFYSTHFSEGFWRWALRNQGKVRHIDSSLDPPTETRGDCSPAFFPLPLSASSNGIRRYQRRLRRHRTSVCNMMKSHAKEKRSNREALVSFSLHREA